MENPIGQFRRVGLEDRRIQNCVEACDRHGVTPEVFGDDMKLHFKLAIVLLLVLFGASIWTVASDYQTSRQDVESDLRREAANIRAVLMATRRVYHHQFINSGLELNDDTIGFLPAHAMLRISQDFKNWTDSGLVFNNVSDRPRNPANQADDVELQAIQFFKDNPREEERFVPFKTEDGDAFYHYSRPIWVESYCLKCHGKRDEAPAAIRDSYETAFNYRVGDLRGIMSVKLPSDAVESRATAAASRNWWSHVATMTIAFLLIYGFVVHMAVRKLRALQHAASEVADGNLECSTGVAGSDEIGQVAKAFDSMVAKLTDRDTKMTAALQQEHLASQRLEAAVVELKAAKQSAETATQTKNEFLANMSHEIRTPMTAILGFSDVLLGSVSEPDQVDGLRTIKKNGEYLLGIINDILDISKIESGKLEVEQIECSPHEILAEVASLLRVKASAKRLPLEVQYETALPETIRSDPTRLRQILINLTGNAIKFTELGSVRLVARALDVESEDPQLQIDVVDTGIGVNAGQRDKLFQPFCQADTSTTRRFGGTGLGLAISKRLAEMLGGEIVVYRTSSAGSTFRVTVSAGPLDGVRMLDAPHQEPGADPGDARQRREEPLACRVLLAEDGPDNQRLLSFVLKKAGAEVTVAENGQVAFDEALAARAAGNQFDVVLMDMQMPVLDGYEATRRLRDAGYAGPIVALTAHAMSGDRAKCIAAGCDDYTTKPIDRDALVQLVRGWRDRQTTGPVS